MADFKAAYDITNGNEGGWQNDPNDAGNDHNGLGTYRGIASAEQPGWKGWPIVEAAIAAQGPQPTYGTPAYRAWVHTLNGALAANAELQASVQSFYRVNFWDCNRLGDLDSQAVANKCYDSGVNQGTGTAARLLQGCLGVAVDGSIGPVTIAAANRAGDALAETFKAARIAKYQATVTAHPNDAQYLDGWIARC